MRIFFQLTSQKQAQQPKQIKHIWQYGRNYIEQGSSSSLHCFSIQIRMNKLFKKVA